MMRQNQVGHGRARRGEVRQQEVFEYTGRQIVQDVFNGYNGTGRAVDGAWPPVTGLEMMPFSK